ncbi:MAG: GIY-YIG nuclease family protein [Clostridia bacterium]
MYYTYMLRCEDNSIYTGITTDIERRMKEHFEKDKKCAKYTFTHSAKKIEALWRTENKSLASKLEFHIKKLKKAEKEELIINKDLEKYLGEKIEVDKYEYTNYFTNIE